MKKADFFKNAIKAKVYTKRAWVISAFAITAEAPDEWKKDPYNYRIVRTATVIMFVLNNELVIIEDADVNKPLFRFREAVTAEAYLLKNLDKDIETTYGNIYLNSLLLSDCFGSKIPYTNNLNAGKIESYISDRLTDSDAVPKSQRDENDKSIYVDELIAFGDAINYNNQFSQLCVQGATKATMTAPPGALDLKKKLLLENKDRLHDPAVVAKINDELVNYAIKTHLSKDNSMDFLLGDKATRIVYSKMFLMHGGETGLREAVGIDLIANSLEQGWDKSKFPIMNNSLRSGSFHRGALTQNGGEAVKWLLRVSSNIKVTEEDCGTKLGKRIFITKDNYKKLKGLYVFENDESVFIEDDAAGEKYIGSFVNRRTPQRCIFGKTDYCKKCVGERLSASPTGLSLTISDYGNALLSMFMAGAHAKALVTAHMDYRKALT